MDKLIAKLIEAIEKNPQGIETNSICDVLRKTPQQLGDAFEEALEEDLIVGFAGRWLTIENWDALVQAITDVMRGFHDAKPAQVFFETRAIFENAGLVWSPKQIDRATKRLVEDGVIYGSPEGIRLATAKLSLTPRQRDFVQRIKTELESSGFSTPNPHRLSQRLQAPIQAVEEIVKLGGFSGELVVLDDGVMYSFEQTLTIQSALHNFAKDKPFSAGQARDWLEVSRRHIIPLLEYYDQVGICQRNGDLRTIQSAESAPHQE